MLFRIERYLRYQKLVLGKSWNATKRHFSGLKLIELVFASGISLIILAKVGGIEAVRNEWLAIVSVIGGAIGWGIVVLLYNYAMMPFYIYLKSIERKAEGIAIRKKYPLKVSIRRTGLQIINDKDCSIHNCLCYLNFFQVDKERPEFIKLPYCLAWVVDGQLVWEGITMNGKSTAEVALQKNDLSLQYTVMVKVPPRPGVEKKDYGPSTGIEIGDQGGLALFRDRKYILGFHAEYEIENRKYVTQPEYFEADYAEEGTNIKLKKLPKKTVRHLSPLVVNGANARG